MINKEIQDYIDYLLFLKYVLISWPEIQDFMEHERWEECIFCQEIEGHPCPDSTYAVPVNLYKEIYNIQ